METTVFATELLNTRYLCSALAYKLGQALSALPDETVVDLAGTKLGPGAYAMIVQHMNHLVFVNSESEKLDNILKTKQDFVRNIKKPNLKIPAINTYQDIVDFVNSVPTGLSYYMFEYDTSEKSLEALVALIIARPELYLDISNMYVEVFTCLEKLGCRKTKNVVYVNKINRTTLSRTIVNGYDVWAPIEFGTIEAIDLLNPDSKHLFYKVVCNLQKRYEEQKYHSFIDAIKDIM